MRILVFFDLPVKTKEERRDSNKFRRFLCGDGYDMLQLSVYSRVCSGGDVIDKHLKRLTTNLPPKGSVRFLQITEKQYSSMLFLVGNPTLKEKKIGANQLVLF